MVESLVALTLFVAADGDDSHSGRNFSALGPDGPFATLERARDEIRRIKDTQGLPPGGIAVELATGTYSMPRTLVFDARDSGTEAAPILYRARPQAQVRLAGGKTVGRFSKPDEKTLARLDPAARPHVLQSDLKALGIEDYGSPGGGGIELFFADQPMTLARWPNDGFVQVAGLVGGDPIDVRGTQGDRIGKFHYEGDRPRRWTAEQDPWVHGYWFWDWSDQRHRVDSIDAEARVIAVEPPYHSYGYRQGQWYYAMNILAELDSPGEWYVDRQKGILYFWPPGPLEAGHPTLSVLDTLVEIDGAEHLSFEHLSFEAARATAVTISDSRHIRILGCTLRNIGSWALHIEGGQDNGVIGCDIYQTGDGGIYLAGGDRQTLEPAGHFALNNHIHHYSRLNRMYKPAVSLNGVGQRASHNLIHDAPHMAIFFGGNDHLIEFNEIHSVCYESNDAGALYAGRDWTMRGTRIRHNYLHHIDGFQGKGCVGVYLDDMFSGTEIFGNLFYKVTRAAFIGGGRDCRIQNNIFVDCQPALHLDARAMNWAAYHVDTTMRERLLAMPYQNELWTRRYPLLPKILADEPAAPKGNIVSGNISLGGTWNGVHDDARSYIDLSDNLVDTDPGFVSTPPQSFALKADSPAFKLGFQTIPHAKIGLYQDDMRASWPVKHHVRPSAKK
jgi:hypothetical protein